MIDFQTYHEANPHVYAAFKAKAIEAMQKGFTHFGHKAIFELIRWQTKTAGNDGFKINNNYTADYARKLMQERAEFKDFFHCRTLRAYRGRNLTEQELIDEFHKELQSHIDRQTDNTFLAFDSKKYPPDLTGLMSSMVSAKCTCSKPLRRFDIDNVEYCGICDMNL